MQKFRHKPIEIVIHRFYNNQEEIDKFLAESNDIYGREYKWKFEKVGELPLIVIREYLPARGAYSYIEVEHGDYISRDEHGIITAFSQEDIEEFYDEVRNVKKE